MEEIQNLIKEIVTPIPKAVKFLAWVACAFIILPAVYIAGNWYQGWTEWGEKF